VKTGDKRGGRYPDAIRQRAVRLVFEHQDEYPSQWRAIESVATKLGINRETLRQWVRRAEIDAGQRVGLTSDERARIVELERENRELRRANEILKAASAFFGAELDRQSQI
jgi:transposase